MSDEEAEALYQFCKAHLEDRGWTLEKGYNAYTQDWLDRYLRLKEDRLGKAIPRP